MNYWIVALARADMEHCIRIGTFGAKRAAIINRVQEGDRVACYVTKEFKIVALAETTSDYYVDDKPIFRSEDDMFIDRFKFKARKLSPEVDFMQLIDKMSFITNLAYWSVYFRNGIVKITKADWEEIEKLASTKV